MNYPLFSLLFSLLCCASACSALQIQARKPQAQIGIQVRSVKSGKILYEENPNQKFIPASTLKIFTLATALHVLGPSYRFETQVFYDGNLYLKGSGDPSFSVHSLNHLAGQIRQLIKTPIKNIIIDDSVFDGNYYGNGWLEEDLPKGYSAPISGINVNYNRLVVGFLPGQKILLDPDTQFVKLKFHKNGNFNITGHGMAISGHIPVIDKAQYKTFSISDPNLWAGFLFKEALKRVGIKITGHIQSGLVPQKLTPITTHYSAYLSELAINHTKFSNNLANEALLKTLGSGSFEKGLEKVRAFVGCEGIADGSGLSVLSSISPAQMTDFLVKIAHDFQIAPEFMTALPIAGKDGSLAHSFQKEPFLSHMRAKTGMMTSVRALAGYFKPPNGDMVAFALFANELKSPPEKLRAWLELILSKNI